MNIEKIQKIQAMYREVKNHEAVKQAFGLNNAQEYAINILGRDKMLPAAMLADYIGEVKEGMTVGEIAVVLGFPAEASLSA